MWSPRNNMGFFRLLIIFHVIYLFIFYFIYTVLIERAIQNSMCSNLICPFVISFTYLHVECSSIFHILHVHFNCCLNKIFVVIVIVTKLTISLKISNIVNRCTESAIRELCEARNYRAIQFFEKEELVYLIEMLCAKVTIV